MENLDRKIKPVSTTRKFTQAALITGVLVVLPLIGWFNSRNALKDRRALLAEMGDYGVVDSLITFKEAKGDAFSFGKLKGKVYIIDFFDIKPTAATKQFIETNTRLYEQFGAVEMAAFAHLTTDSIEKVKAYITDFKQQGVLKNEDQSMNAFLTASDSSLQVFTKSLHLPDSIKKEDVLVLIDAEGQVRNFYNRNNREQMQRLVRHFSMIIPFKKEEKPTVKQAEDK